MYPLTTTGNDIGKNIAVSFPFHEKHLIKDLDLLAHYDCVNRSAWIRKKIREEKLKLKNQESNVGTWGNIFSSN
jgi:hypothetical protein